MPYLAAKRNALSSDLAGAGTAPVASSAAAPAAAADSPAYQDLRAYLSANAPQAKELAGRILSPIEASAQSAATPLLGTADRPEYVADKNAARLAATTRLKGTGDTGFWGGELEGIGGGTYSSGQRNMDDYLLTASGARADAQALRDRYAALLGKLDLPAPTSKTEMHLSPLAPEPAPENRKPGPAYDPWGANRNVPARGSAYDPWGANRNPPPRYDPWGANPSPSPEAKKTFTPTYRKRF